MPDENQPTIAVVTKTGTTAKARKWANDKNPDFDPLYEYLLGICRSADGRQPIREGPIDWEWRWQSSTIRRKRVALEEHPNGHRHCLPNQSCPGRHHPTER